MSVTFAEGMLISTDFTAPPSFGETASAVAVTEMTTISTTAVFSRSSRSEAPVRLAARLRSGFTPPLVTVRSKPPLPFDNVVQDAERELARRHLEARSLVKSPGFQREVRVDLGRIGNRQREGFPKQEGHPVEVGDAQRSVDMTVHGAEHRLELFVLKQAPEPDDPALLVLSLGQGEVGSPGGDHETGLPGRRAAPFFLSRASRRVRHRCRSRRPAPWSRRGALGLDPKRQAGLEGVLGEADFSVVGTERQIEVEVRRRH